MFYFSHNTACHLCKVEAGGEELAERACSIGHETCLNFQPRVPIKSRVRDRSDLGYLHVVLRYVFSVEEDRQIDKTGFGISHTK